MTGGNPRQGSPEEDMSGRPQTDRIAAMHASAFGLLDDGTPVQRYRLSGGGISMEVLDYGGTITRLEVPDATGHPRNVVLGHAELAGYLSSTAFFGCLVGRYANRIANGKFTLDGKDYQVENNEGVNHLHGGFKGFDKRVWTVLDASADRIVLQIVSPDGDGGYPGELTVVATYTLSDGEVRTDYEATTTAPTIVNLTNHTYFNLEGEDAPTAEGHLLKINADFYTPTNSTQIPTHVAPVDGTPFDWRAPTRIGDQIRIPHEQIMAGLGVDHNFVVRGEGLREHATLSATGSGITLTVVCDQPAVQCYTGNYLNGKLIGTSGRTYRQSSGIALETQHYPDSPNQPEFPTTVLRPGEKLKTSTIWLFSASK